MPLSKQKASRQFVDDFMLVVAHYLCTPAEIEEAKQIARDDMEEAEICYASLAREIRA